MKINDPNSPFDGFEVISSYTDQQAIDDGVLVAISPNNRVTRAAWEHFRESMPMTGIHADVPTDVLNKMRDSYALSTAHWWILMGEDEGRRVYEQNVDGGIFKIIRLGRTFWLMPNEQGGMTLMFPEDY